MLDESILPVEKCRKGIFFRESMKRVEWIGVPENIIAVEPEMARSIYPPLVNTEKE